MNHLRTLSRRAFLVGSVAVAGGVMFGTYLVRSSSANPLLDGLAEGDAAITSYVRITRDGIALITPRADMGQGAYSIQAALIAEELDVGLDQLDLANVTPGKPAAAYFNIALVDELVPFAFHDNSTVAQTWRSVVGAAIKIAGVQVTGGSTTVHDSYEKLRVAGAVARETLKEAAAQRRGATRTELTTEDGHVVLPDGVRIAYADLAAEASKISPVEHVTLRPEGSWRILGKPMLRIDIVAKSTGTLKYGIDHAVDGMVHATVKTNPHLDGKMLDFDAREAKAMTGVHHVVPVKGGVGVIADNTWTAMKAAKAIRFVWGAATYPGEMADHWRTLREAFVEERRECRFRHDRDEAAARGGTDVAEVEYRAPYLAHAPLEPLNAIVQFTDQRIDIWTGTQIPRFIQCNVSRITGVPVEDIHVHVQMMGGSFGHRLEDDYVHRAVELAMALPGTPVKMTYSREQDMEHEFPRQIAMARGRGKVANGRIVAFSLDIAMPSLASSQLSRLGIPAPGPDPVIGFGAFDQPYKIPNYRVTGYRALDLVPISSWRSVGASTNVFFHECLFDELAHAVGADPLSERLRLLVDHPPSYDVLKTVAEMSGWFGSTISPPRGRGVAFGVSFGVPVAEVVEVTVTDRGVRMDNVWVAVNVGHVLDPVNFDNLVKGGVVFGLGHAVNCEMTYSDGRALQTNYHAHAGMRMHQCPKIEVQGLTTNPHLRGIGEPPIPPAAPALANAIFNATGCRIREMPFDKFIDFV